MGLYWKKKLNIDYLRLKTKMRKKIRKIKSGIEMELVEAKTTLSPDRQQGPNDSIDIHENTKVASRKGQKYKLERYGLHTRGMTRDFTHCIHMVHTFYSVHILFQFSFIFTHLVTSRVISISSELDPVLDS